MARASNDDLRLSQIPISDEILAFYVDGCLNAEQRLEVEAYLAKHPEAARQVIGYMHDNLELHRAYDRYLVQPLPPTLTRLQDEILERLWQCSREPSRKKGTGIGIVPRGARRFAVTATVLAVGLAIGGIIWASMQPLSLTSEHASLFSLFSYRENPPSQVAVEPTLRDAATRSAAAAEMAEPRERSSLAPDFSGLGFELIGTRVLTRDKRNAVQLQYENEDGHRVSLYYMDAEKTEKRSLDLLQQGPLTLLFWSTGGRDYAIVGEVEKETLLQLGTLVNGDEAEAAAPPSNASPSGAQPAATGSVAPAKQER